MMKVRRTIALIVVTIAAGFGLYRCSYVPLHCSANVWSSEKELLSAAERDDAYSKATAGRHGLGHLLDCESRPLDVNRPVLIALSYRFLEQHAESVLWYERALSIDRRPEIYLGLGIEQVRAKRRQDGIENLATACAFAPGMLEAIEDPALRDAVRARVVARYGKHWM